MDHHLVVVRLPVKETLRRMGGGGGLLKVVEFCDFVAFLVSVGGCYLRISYIPPSIPNSMPSFANGRPNNGHSTPTTIASAADAAS